MADKVTLIRDNIEVEINNSVIGYEDRADGNFPVIAISDEDDRNILKAFGISSEISLRISRPGERDTNFVRVKIKGIDRQYWYDRSNRVLTTALPDDSGK